MRHRRWRLRVGTCAVIRTSRWMAIGDGGAVTSSPREALPWSVRDNCVSLKSLRVIMVAGHRVLSRYAVCNNDFQIQNRHALECHPEGMVPCFRRVARFLPDPSSRASVDSDRTCAVVVHACPERAHACPVRSRAMADRVGIRNL